MHGQQEMYHSMSYVPLLDGVLSPLLSTFFCYESHPHPPRRRRQVVVRDDRLDKKVQRRRRQDGGNDEPGSQGQGEGRPPEGALSNG